MLGGTEEGEHQRRVIYPIVGSEGSLQEEVRLQVPMDEKELTKNGQEIECAKA